MSNFLPVTLSFLLHIQVLLTQRYRRITIYPYTLYLYYSRW